MTPLIYNRDPNLGNKIWVLAVPRGEIPNEQSGIVQVVDDIALNSIVANLDEEKRRLGGRFPGIYFGREHHIYIADESSEALGWGMEWKVTETGLWILVELTDIGLEAIRNNHFKYTSFVTAPAYLQMLDGKRGRVMKIENVGFTNLPNAKDLLVPIGNRPAGLGNGAPSAKPSEAIQKRAAQRISQLALAEQRSSGVSLSQAWQRVQNRNSGLADLASGRPVSSGVTTEAREVLEDAADFAGRTILRLAQSRKMPGLSANLSYIKNRFPRLARMENRQAGWDVLADLEPEARQAYMDAVQGTRNSMPEPRLRTFLALVDGLATEFPDLGYEGRWQKMKELYPATFLNFVLSFDDEEGSDMLAPPAQTEQERYQEKRARIAQAARTEARHYGRNGPGAERLAQDTVNEALGAL
jgi:hypothetical protein